MSFFTNKTSMSELKEGKCNKKGPIWSHFSISESDKSKAICNYCLGAYSLGSDKPKYQTSTNLKGHLKSKHTSEYLKFNKTEEVPKIRNEKRIRENDCDQIPTSVYDKKQKIEMSQETISGRDMVKLTNEVYFTESGHMNTFFSNKETNCILYSEDGERFDIHKEVLGQTETLRSILSSSKNECCRPIEIFCPCSKSELDGMIKFLYNGKIFCETKEELLTILDNLHRIFGFPRKRLILDESLENQNKINFLQSSFEIISPKKVDPLKIVNECNSRQRQEISLNTLGTQNFIATSFDYDNLLLESDMESEAEDEKVPFSESKEEKYSKKGPIWNHFYVSKSDISKAICNHCGGIYSLGSDKPKYQTSTNLKGHLKSKHKIEFSKLTKNVEESEMSLNENGTLGTQNFTTTIHNLLSESDIESEAEDKKVPIHESKEEKHSRKGPIWNHFYVSKSDLSKAFCNHCGGRYSLGSDKPKYQTSSNLKNHLRSKHYSEFSKLLQIVEELGLDIEKVPYKKENNDNEKHFFEESNFSSYLAAINEDKKHFQCNFCNYAFSSNSELKRHILTVHEKKKSFTCEICDNSYLTKTNLERHVAQHEGKNQINCEVCDFITSKKSELKKHVAVVHEGKTLLRCESCDYTCLKKSNMNEHIAIVHFGRRPFKCNICDYRSAKKQERDRHVASIHEGKKPFHCEICNQRFSRKYHLTQHILTVHDGKKSYQCQFCDHSTLQKALLIKHIAADHGGKKLFEFKMRNRSFFN